MILQKLKVRGFRAHEETEVRFGPRVNLIQGPNGAGKTNLLEAIHYLCLTKSFETADDMNVLRKGAHYFEVEGEFESRGGRKLRMRIAYVPEKGKRAFINGVQADRLADVVGRVPVVALTPGDKAISAGGPEERRRFMNNTMSQAHRVYLDDMMKYRRAIRQRNALLLQAKRTRTSKINTLDAWDEEIIALGSRIVAARAGFEKELKGQLGRAYQMFESIGEKPTMDYVPGLSLNRSEKGKGIEELFRENLLRLRDQERRRGRTLIGPHRDEIVFKLNNMEVRKYASQGQHRTFGMALKLATYYYLEEHMEERPILLLDDVFGDLDPVRRRTFLEILCADGIGQSMITTAGGENLEAMGDDLEVDRRIFIKDGRVYDQSNQTE